MAVTSFKAMVADIKLDLNKVERETLPFASIVALTRTAVQARDLVRAEMPRIFKSPTPYTVNAVRAMPATKATLASAVLLRTAGEVPAGDYLGPEILDGFRNEKRSERALQLADAMLPGQFEMPSREAVLDAYGNIPRGEIVKILSGISPRATLAKPAIRRSHKRQGFKTRQTGSPFFVAKSKRTGKPLGIWQVVSSGHVEPVLIFANRAPVYLERFPFDDMVARLADRLFPAELKKALLEFSGR